MNTKTNFVSCDWLTEITTTSHNYHHLKKSVLPVNSNHIFGRLIDWFQ